MRTVDAATGAGAVVQEAYAAGHAVRVVTGGRDKASTLAAFATDLALPSWFGGNLDALVDALRALADAQGRVLELVWVPAATLAREHPRAYAAVLDALATVEGERTDLQVTVVGSGRARPTTARTATS
jgi:RNAse (barnase) inhibitor barstar